jgi:hypothetical protein
MHIKVNVPSDMQGNRFAEPADRPDSVHPLGSIVGGGHHQPGRMVPKANGGAGLIMLLPARPACPVMVHVALADQILVRQGQVSFA